MPSVSFADIEAAHRVVSRHLPPTPAWSYPLLDEAVGAHVLVKHENVQPTGAFKVRGGVTLFGTMSAQDLARGIVSCSTGNHAQSMAYGAALYGSRAVIVMPESAPADKVAATSALGAEVVLHGATMTEAADRAGTLAAERGLLLVSPGDHPAVLAGHGTAYLELFRQHPDLDAVLVPAGSGTGAAGACLAAEALAPGCRVIAVQSDAAPAAYQSWRTGELVEAPCRTRVSGLATGRGFAGPQAVLRHRLHDFVLVSDDDIAEAALLLATLAHTLAEGAGAAALAGLLTRPDLKGASVAAVCTGGNASSAELAGLAGLAGQAGRAGRAEPVQPAAMAVAGPPASAAPGQSTGAR